MGLWQTRRLSELRTRLGAPMCMQKIIGQIAAELGAAPQQVAAAVELLDGGATVPFIARYRKEATGGLDDTQLRTLQERLTYLRELQDRRGTVLKAIDEQGKLTDALRLAIAQAATKQELEDLYLPFKQKRRTKGQIAKEFGLEPLADRLLAQPQLDALQEAQAFCQPATLLDDGKPGPDFSTPQAVLDGVRDILSERWAEDASLVQSLREWLWQEGLLRSSLVAGKSQTDAEVAKFRDYFDYEEPIGRVPSHRALAVFRGRSLEILDAKLVQPQEPQPGQPSLAEGRIALHLGWSHQGRKSDDLLRKCVAWTWRVKLSLSVERDLFTRLREAAEAVAIKVFGDNLRDLLLAAPAGPRAVMGLDPGIRTGVKVAVVNHTGKLLETSTVFPHEPRRDWEGSVHTLAALALKHGVELIAIGNGTASRETDKLAADVIKLWQKTAQTQAGQASQALQKIVISEAGASVYSASEFASQELPELDVSLRGAVSIARRLQDPLAELVKIDPKSIGVGQYQHDVNQKLLSDSLDFVVDTVVNQVGVNVNTASPALLSHVAGLNKTISENIVTYRVENGALTSRQQLKKVPRLGDKAFEQAAGFLRIPDGTNFLDNTGVHPESYKAVETLLKLLEIDHLDVAAQEKLKQISIEKMAEEIGVGQETLKDIIADLLKPGRDLRDEFAAPVLRQDVLDFKDLQIGQKLEGVVRNVVDFGAFVDIGIHEDGLIHISNMSKNFIKHPSQVVSVGDLVTVWVHKLDQQREKVN